MSAHETTSRFPPPIHLGWLAFVAVVSPALSVAVAMTVVGMRLRMAEGRLLGLLAFVVPLGVLDAWLLVDGAVHQQVSAGLWSRMFALAALALSYGVLGRETQARHGDKPVYATGRGLLMTVVSVVAGYIGVFAFSAVVGPVIKASSEERAVQCEIPAVVPGPQPRGIEAGEHYAKAWLDLASDLAPDLESDLQDPVVAEFRAALGELANQLKQADPTCDLPLEDIQWIRAGLLYSGAQELQIAVKGAGLAALDSCNLYKKVEAGLAAKGLQIQFDPADGLGVLRLREAGAPAVPVKAFHFPMPQTVGAELGFADENPATLHVEGAWFEQGVGLRLLASEDVVDGVVAWCERQAKAAAEHGAFAVFERCLRLAPGSAALVFDSQDPQEGESPGGFDELAQRAVASRNLIGGRTRVTGLSMLPTLHPEDSLFVDALATPRRGDVIVFEMEGARYVERVVGLPGETVTLVGDRVEIQGRSLWMSTTSRARLGQPCAVAQQKLGDAEFEILTGTARGKKRDFLVAERSYFVLGDNRPYSSDSRSFGSVPADSIKGVARAILLNRGDGSPDWSRANRPLGELTVSPRLPKGVTVLGDGTWVDR